MLNRRAWDQLLTSALREGTSPLYIAMIDLDHSKNHNDRHGHLAGDSLLRRAGAAWRAAIRSEDVLARFGGEEFAVLLAGCEEEIALQIAERLRLATIDEQQISIGVARWNGRQTAARLVDRADKRSTRPSARAATASCSRRRPLSAVRIRRRERRCLA